jgi:modification methylase
MGTGTTLLAALAGGRNSIGIEIDETFAESVTRNILDAGTWLNARIARRFSDHLAFVKKRKETKKPPKHLSKNYGFPVVTKQETGMSVSYVDAITGDGRNRVSVTYSGESKATVAVEGVADFASGEDPAGQLSFTF